MDKTKKNAQTTSTQSIYIDADGVEFSAQDIVQGFKPKRPYKLHSLKDRIFKK